MGQRYALLLVLPLLLCLSLRQNPVKSAQTLELGSHQSLALTEDSGGGLPARVFVSCWIDEVILLIALVIKIMNEDEGSE
jgi:hypothetical protein